VEEEVIKMNLVLGGVKHLTTRAEICGALFV